MKQRERQSDNDAQLFSLGLPLVSRPRQLAPVPVAHVTERHVVVPTIAKPVASQNWVHLRSHTPAKTIPPACEVEVPALIAMPTASAFHGQPWLA